MSATVTGILVNSEGTPLANALVTFLPTNTPLIDVNNRFQVIASALVRTRTAANGVFNQVLRQARYRAEFAETDRMNLQVSVSSGTINIGTIVIP